MDGQCLQTFQWRHPLAGAENLALPCHPVHRGPKDKELIDGSHVEIGVVGKADPLGCRRFQWADEFRLCETAVGDMGAPKKVDVLGVKRRDEVPGGDFVQLVRSDELAMDDSGAMVARLFVAQSGGMGFKDGVDGGVPVGMNDQRQAGIIDPLFLFLRNFYYS